MRNPFGLFFYLCEAEQKEENTRRKNRWAKRIVHFERTESICFRDKTDPKKVRQRSALGPANTRHTPCYGRHFDSSFYILYFPICFTTGQSTARVEFFSSSRCRSMSKAPHTHRQTQASQSGRSNRIDVVKERPFLSRAAGQTITRWTAIVFRIGVVKASHV